MSEAVSFQKKKLNLISFSNFKLGIILSLLAQPFEVIRTSSIINQASSTNINFGGMMNIIKQIKTKEGIRGFFRGGVLSGMKTTASAGLFFTGLENLNNIVDKIPGTTSIFSQKLINFSNAALSKGLTTLIISPINVLKTRFEVSGNNEYKSIYHATLSIKKKEGYRGFYRGIIATLIRDVPYSGIQYSIYTSILDIYAFLSQKNRSSSQKVIMFAGAVSSASAIMITYPFDNIRVRYQFDQGQSIGMYKLCEEIYMKEGIIGFYKGYLPRLLKKICSGALTWTIYEHIKKSSNSGYSNSV